MHITKALSRSMPLDSACCTILVLALAVGCGGSGGGGPRVEPDADAGHAGPDAGSDPGAGPARRSGGCKGTGIELGSDLEVDIEHGGNLRRYLLHVPERIDPTTPVPLVLSYHGKGATPELQAAQSGLDAKADAEGFVVVYPEAAHGMFKAGGWAGLYASPPHAEDDADLARAVVDDVADKLCIDLRRVYSTGMGEGGLMSEWDACRNADIFAAVAAVASIQVHR